MLSIKLAVNRYAFHWAYPEMLADELGIFGKNGMQVEWSDATPPRMVSKSSMYEGLLERGETDVYHAGEWACISRVLRSPGSAIVAKSRPGRGTLNSSFSLFVRGDSDVRSPKDLAGRTVAIEEGTGAQYTAISDLERYMRAGDIKLVQAGEPHKRLMALLGGNVEAASLVGPWVDAGRALGLRQVLRTNRKNPTTIVVRKTTGVEVLRRFFASVNEAIRRMNRSPGAYRASYYGQVKKVLAEMPKEVSAKVTEGSVTVPRWSEWEPYTSADFSGTYGWMVERSLAPPGRSPADVVADYSADLFG